MSKKYPSGQFFGMTKYLDRIIMHDLADYIAEHWRTLSTLLYLYSEFALTEARGRVDKDGRAGGCRSTSRSEFW